MHRSPTFLGTALLIGLAGCSGHNSATPSLGLPPMSNPALQSAQAAWGSGAAVSVNSAASSLKYFKIGNAASTDAVGYSVIQGADAKLYYTTLGPISCSQSCFSGNGNVGVLDPLTGSFSETALGAAPWDLHFAPDGALWTTELNAGSLARIPLPISIATVKTIPLPPAPSPNSSPAPRTITIGSDNNLWFTDYGGHRIGKIDPAGPYVTNAIKMFAVANGPVGTPQVRARPDGITNGSDANLWFVDRSNGVIYKTTTAGAMTPFITPEQRRLGSSNSSFPAFITNGSDGRLYFSEFSGTSPGSLEAMSTSGTFQNQPTLPNPGPYFVGSGNGLVVFADFNYGAVGMHKIGGSTRELPIGNQGLNGVLVAKDGSVWFMCYQAPAPGQPLCIGHIVLTSTWSVFPGQQMTLPIANGSALVGIGETGNSGPFRLVSSKTTVVTVSSIPQEDHNFILNPVAPGTTSVTVTDAHGRTVVIAITVK